MPQGRVVRVTTEGRKAPLFMVPAAACTPLSFVNLARAFKPARPLFAYCYPGTDDDSPFQSCVEDIAEDYLSTIRDIQPNGPYVLGGHCFGGLVAYEAAYRLIRDGDEVLLVALIATSFQDSQRIPVSGIQTGGAGEFSNDDSGHSAPSKAEMDEKLAKLDKARADKLKRMRLAQDSAYRRYEAQPLDVSLLVFSATDTPPSMFERWCQMSTNRVKVLESRAGASAILSKPFAAGLANEIERACSEACGSV